MNESTECIIPEYWYLRITEENLNEITNWRNGVFGLTGKISNKDYIYSYGTTREPFILKNEYKEITTPFFKEIIIKNSIYKPIKNKDMLSLFKLLDKLNIK